MKLDEIIINQYLEKEENLAPYACKTKDAIRLGKEKVRNEREFNVRPDFSRDASARF